MIEKIISGGQTGADQGALDYALEQGIPCGGWCPKGRLCESGRIPDKYPVREVDSDDYDFRTRKNISDSDGTLIIIKGALKETGTRLTKSFCVQSGKPFMVIDIHDPVQPDMMRKDFRHWVQHSKIRTLNVAGNRESSSPGIQSATKQLLFILQAGKEVPDLGQ